MEAAGPPRIDTSVAHSARVHDYWLGGKDNFAADRAVGDAVDYDPVVLQHARALLASGPRGTVDYIDADLRDTQKILGEAARTLDFSQPVAIMLIAVMHLIVDADDPYGIAGQLKDAMPAGSHLALSRVASDIEPERMAEAASRDVGRRRPPRVTARAAE